MYNGKLNFIIEQYKWDKWVVVGEVMGQGTATGQGTGAHSAGQR
jgi:hypothetical protein